MPPIPLEDKYFLSNGKPDKSVKSRLVRVDVMPSSETGLTGTDNEIELLYKFIIGKFANKCTYAVVGFEKGDHSSENREHWHYHWLLHFKDQMSPRYRAALRQDLEQWNGSRTHNVTPADGKVLDMIGYITKSDGIQEGAKIKVFGNLPVSLDDAKMHYRLKDVVHTHGQSVQVLGKNRDKQEQIRFCRQFIIEIMKKHGISMRVETEGYVDANFREVSEQSFIDLLEREGILNMYDPEQVAVILKQTQVNAQSQPARLCRVPFPRYRASRRYLMFADGIYDLFDDKLCPLDKQLVGDDGLSVVHPVYKFDKPFNDYDKVPEFYLRHVARLHSGSEFMMIFKRFLKPLIRKQCSILLKGPPNAGKTVTWIPIIHVFKNVIGLLNADDGKFSWAGYGPHSIIFGDDVNPLVSGIFYDRPAFLNITGGYSFTPPVKGTGVERGFQPKIQLYTTNDEITTDQWQPGYKERLAYVVIPDDCPRYNPTVGLSHEEVEQTILDELGQIVFYVIKKPVETMKIIDSMRSSDEPPAYETIC